MNQKLKIILLIFAVTFLINVSFASAAIKYVPTPQQLQPSPLGIEPNLSGNVNYIDPNSESQTSEEDGNNSENKNIEPPTGTEKKSQPSLIANIISLPEQNSAAGKTVWWLIVLALAGVGTWLVKKRYDKK